MLHGHVCPVTAAVGAAAVAGTVVLARREKSNVSPAKFASVAAFIFAAQMMNFPIRDGTSGHLIGGVLAAAMLGVPLGMLAMTIVLAVQCLVFSDGGLTVLGAMC